MSDMKQPDADVLAKHFEYLDALRSSGIVNMFGARSYLAKARRLKADAAGDVLAMWMKSFSKADTLDGRAKWALADKATKAEGR